MPNYDYANSAGLTALSERTFEKIKSKITTDVVTSEAANPITIETDAAQYAKKTHLTLEPVQDLHGYDHPWPAGGGKNKVAFVNSGLTVNGITFTVNKDSDGNVISFTANGTASARASFALCDFNLPAGTYVLNGNPNGSGDTYWVTDSASAFSGKVYGGNSITATVPEGQRVLLLFQVEAGVTVTKETVYPMIRLASESDATFAPYSNICPITGVDEIEVRATGFNQWDEEWEHKKGYSTGAMLDSNSNIASKNYIPVLPDTEYNFTFPTGVAFYVYGYDANQNYISTVLYVRDNIYRTQESCRYIKFATRNDAYSGDYNHDICINISDAEKNGTYEPYTEYTASLDLPEPVYSGTLDLETGEVVVDWKKIKLRDLSIPDRTTTYFYSSTTTDKEYGATKVKCSCYKTVDVPAGDMPECSIKGNGGNSYLYITDTRFSTGAELKNALGDQDIAYELATPITYHLTPQQLALFKGINNISTNAKTIQVTYREGHLATLEELNAISSDLSNVKSKLPPIIIKDGMLQVTYDDGQ